MSRVMTVSLWCRSFGWTQPPGYSELLLQDEDSPLPVFFLCAGRIREAWGSCCSREGTKEDFSLRLHPE